MGERPTGALVRELPRVPGARETRWMHLVSGESAPESAAASPVPAGSAEAVTVGEIAALKANVDRLENEVAQLRETVARLCRELGG